MPWGAIELLPAGGRRRALAKAFDTMLHDDLAGCVGAFDSAAAEEAGALAARRQRRGRPVDLRDTQIAGLDVTVVNPWAG